MHHISLLLLFAGLFTEAAYSQQKPASAYPQNPAVSDAQGYPRDSSTLYFPAAASSYAMDTAQIESCRYQFQAASCNLLFLGAPILSNYYLGTETYRFLWLRSFHRPVLLTLQQRADGGMLRTQLLSKSACAPRMTTTLFIPPGASAAQEEKLCKQFNTLQADPEIQRELAKQNQPATQLRTLETIRPVSPQQWQQFKQLLTKSRFQESMVCESSSVMDGAYWILESHQASGYHMVFRHSPSKENDFRKACKYLIDLSSVRHEKQY